MAEAGQFTLRVAVAKGIDRFGHPSDASTAGAPSAALVGDICGSAAVSMSAYPRLAQNVDFNEMSRRPKLEATRTRHRLSAGFDPEQPFFDLSNQRDFS